MITIPETPFTRDGLRSLELWLKMTRAALLHPDHEDRPAADALRELEAAAVFAADLLELEPDTMEAARAEAQGDRQEFHL